MHSTAPYCLQKGKWVIYPQTMFWLCGSCKCTKLNNILNFTVSVGLVRDQMVCTRVYPEETELMAYCYCPSMECYKSDNY